MWFECSNAPYDVQRSSAADDLDSDIPIDRLRTDLLHLGLLGSNHVAVVVCNHAPSQVRPDNAVQHNWYMHRSKHRSTVHLL